jgi:acetyl esterase/lipase
MFDPPVNKEVYYDLLSALPERAEFINIEGLRIEIRNCLDRHTGKLDPRVALPLGLKREDFDKNFKQYDSALWPNAEHLFEPRNTEGRTRLELLRNLFGWVSDDVSEGVTAKRFCIESLWGPVVTWAYQKASAKKNRPCLLFFHGGGFFAGNITTVENQCKLIAERSEALVLSVDYPLAPENPYPIGFDCCYAALEWARDHASELEIDGEKLAVAGDSAGGNLALCCALRGRDSGRPIAYQALIYPTLSRAEKPDDPHWYYDRDMYDNPGGDPLINEQLLVWANLNRQLNQWYIPEETDRYGPYVSPITADPAGLPKTLILTAEYDFLRAECEQYSRILKNAGIGLRHIRYGGITHGTFDRLGYTPQTEDMINEIVKDLVVL